MKKVEARDVAVTLFVPYDFENYEITRHKNN